MFCQLQFITCIDMMDMKPSCYEPMAWNTVNHPGPQLLHPLPFKMYFNSPLAIYFPEIGGLSVGGAVQIKRNADGFQKEFR